MSVRLSHVRPKVVPMRDAVFLAAFAAALVIGAQVYAATGWAMPGLIDKEGSR